MERRSKQFGQGRGGGRRKHQRAAVTTRVQLVTFSIRKLGRLLNLSVGGAEVEVEAALRSGEEVFLILPAGDVYGRVTWQVGAKCGIEFDTELHPFDVHKIRRGLSLAGV